jgi:hypothetical protein
MHKLVAADKLWWRACLEVQFLETSIFWEKMLGGSLVECDVKAF